ncbi:hypothetical protein [Arthrobacter sp. Rue61a]|uniref:hypothetical protein n=1 Tax=Arthrobacter sp. Rue61a TaxID=1118963 RepID=UPI0002F0794B|nr:hypothetical protein [Arthrobacter sp. Rue61a]
MRAPTPAWTASKIRLGEIGGTDTYEALYEWAEDIHEEIHGLVESITIAALTAETKLAVITTAMACPTKAASDTDQTIGLPVQ